MVTLYHLCWLLAVQIPPGGASDGAADAAGDAAEGGGWFSGLGFFLPAMLLVMVLYMMLMGKPQQKENARTSEMLANLKKNDRIVTAGGIVGTVVNNRPDAEYLTIRIDDANNTRMQILKQSVIRVLKDDDKKGDD